MVTFEKWSTNFQIFGILTYVLPKILSRYDLSSNLQQQRKNKLLNQSQPKQQCNKKFLWNGDLLLFKNVFKHKDWLVPMIHGFVEGFRIDGFQDLKFEYTLISRRSRFSTGARYLKRGINTCGHWANEVESEHVLVANRPNENFKIKWSSFIQIRASIPLFWRNYDINSFKPKFSYDPVQNIGYKSSMMHLKELKSRYNWDHISIFTLIKQVQGKNNESLIGDKFREFCGAAMDNRFPILESEIEDLKQEEFDIIEFSDADTEPEIKEESTKTKQNSSSSSDDEEEDSVQPAIHIGKKEELWEGNLINLLFHRRINWIRTQWSFWRPFQSTASTVIRHWICKSDRFSFWNWREWGWEREWEGKR